MVRRRLFVADGAHRGGSATRLAMNVLLIGSGGREHALAWSLAKSPALTKLWCAPGNAGIAEFATCVDVDLGNFQTVITFCAMQAIDFVVVGPETPLVAGLVDALEVAGITAFGPTKAAAQLEGSKGFTKDLCAAEGIPTAAYGRFTDRGAALAYLSAQPIPIVIKADGLAAGKGVVIAVTRAEAEAAVAACFDGAFGTAGAEVVIEEFMVGEEASFFVLTDGENILPLATAQDHKRVGDGDTGPNTGGMGAYSPAPCMTPALIQRTLDEIIRPTVAGMARRGMPFKGVLYAGLMLTAEGPKLIEYNCRFGDPETQVILPRLQSDLLAVLRATTDGTLPTLTLQWSPHAALTVVMAANGYPGRYAKGTRINGVADARALPHTTVFHAGTARSNGDLVATGGRVLAVTALGATIAEAQARAYAAVDRIDWPDGFCRRDIGWRAVQRDR
jgi:phosphoribosylamine--glycine ligase